MSREVGLKPYSVLFVSGSVFARWLVGVSVCRIADLTYRGPHPTRKSTDVYRVDRYPYVLPERAKWLGCKTHLATWEEMNEVHL